MNCQAGRDDILIPLLRELPAQGPPPYPQQNEPLPADIVFPKRKALCGILNGMQLDALQGFYGIDFSGHTLEHRRNTFTAYIGMR